MRYIPVKVKPDPKARGWKPQKGWYCYNTKTLQANLSERFNSKKECEKVCQAKNINVMPKEG